MGLEKSLQCEQQRGDRCGFRGYCSRALRRALYGRRHVLAQPSRPDRDSGHAPRSAGSLSTSEWAEASGLTSYGTNFPNVFRLVGTYTGLILKGEKPTDLPVVQPSKFEFVINLKAAKSLGLTIPPTLLALGATPRLPQHCLRQSDTELIVDRRAHATVPVGLIVLSSCMGGLMRWSNDDAATALPPVSRPDWFERKRGC
jgi:hypothetical protein